MSPIGRDRCAGVGRVFVALAAFLALETNAPIPARAEPRIQASLYGLRAAPSGQDARNYTRGGWGGGLRGLITVPPTNHALAFTAGFEFSNLLSETIEFRDPRTQLRVEQQTSQENFRIYVGPELGGHGSGFFRPHVGANLALHIYHFGVDVVVPDDANRENEIRQNLTGNSEAAFGYDVSLGANLNFGKWFLEGGTRFTKSFRVPQTLGEGSVSISPGYAVVYFGLGFNVSRLMEEGENPREQ